MNWMLKTLHSALLDANAPIPPVAACGCGRVVHPDMLYDVRAFTAEERVTIGWMPDTSYVCDSCLAMAERTGAVTLADLYTKQGAPADVIDAVRAYESTQGVT